MTITIELQESSVLVAFKDANGATISRIVDPAELSAALANQLQLDTGLIPRGTRYYVRKDTCSILVLETPPHFRYINFVGNQQFKVPVPPLLFVIRLAKSDSQRFLIRGSCCFALKEALVDHTTMLFNFPFGNVHGGGAICWGSVTLPPLPDLSSASIIPESMLSSTFNGDLGTGMFTPFRELVEGTDINVATSGSLLRHLHEKDTFPYDILTPYKNFETVLKENSN